MLFWSALFSLLSILSQKSRKKCKHFQGGNWYWNREQQSLENKQIQQQQTFWKTDWLIYVPKFLYFPHMLVQAACGWAKFPPFPINFRWCIHCCHPILGLCVSDSDQGSGDIKNLQVRKTEQTTTYNNPFNNSYLLWDDETELNIFYTLVITWSSLQIKM